PAASAPGRGRARSACRRSMRGIVAPSASSVQRREGTMWRRMADVYDAIPKVELHCHVEGTVRPATVIELARKSGRALPVEDPEELYRYTSLDTFLAIFWLVQETLTDPSDWERIAYESLVDAVPHGLRYRETFFTPARHIAAGQTLAGIVDGLSAGIAAAQSETG